MNMEEIISMFRLSKQQSMNATLCYLLCRMRAREDKTVDYIDNIDEQKQENVLLKLLNMGGNRGTKERKKKQLFQPF